MTGSNDKASSGRGRSFKRVVVVLCAIVVVAAVVVVWNKDSGKPVAKASTPPIPVTTARATVQDLPISRSGLGTVLPINQVDVKVRVDGQLQWIAFVEGQEVKAGDVLAEIDPRPYEAVVDAAEATLQKDLAKLASDKTEDARAAKLSATGAGTGQTADKAKAQVAIMEATIIGDRAAVETAKLNLGYTRIVAPIAGRVGLKQINEGAVVHANDATGIVTVTQIHPISVQFALPQDELTDLLVGQAKAPLPVMVYTRDGMRQLATGKLTVIDSQVDTSTGMIKLKAEFENSDRILWPGELVTARVNVRTEANATVVPSAALQNGQGGPYVFVVNGDAVRVVKVTTREAVKGMTQVANGLTAGDEVVVSGQSRLRDGIKIKATPTKVNTASNDQGPR